MFPISQKSSKYFKIVRKINRIKFLTKESIEINFLLTQMEHKSLITLRTLQIYKRKLFTEGIFY